MSDLLAFSYLALSEHLVFNREFVAWGNFYLNYQLYKASKFVNYFFFLNHIKIKLEAVSSFEV